MSDFRPLGPPIRPEVLPKGPKVEATSDPDIWRVNGKLRTVIPENELANGFYRGVPTLPPVAEPIPAGEAVDFLIALSRGLKERMADTEFPISEWASW